MLKDELDRRVTQGLFNGYKPDAAHTLRGLPAGACPPVWAAADPGAFEKHCREHIASGAKFIITPTFEGNPLALARYGLDDRCTGLNSACARAARAAAGDGCLVAAGIGPTGEMWEFSGRGDLEEIIGIYRRQVDGLLEGCPDFFLLETFKDPAEARAAVIAIKEQCALPFAVCLDFKDGGTQESGLHTAARTLFSALGASAVRVEVPGAVTTEYLAPEDEAGTLRFSSRCATAYVSAEGPLCAIGEKINPSGKAVLTREIRGLCTDAALELARSQKDAGAHMLDINAGAGGVDEAEALCALTSAIYADIDIPLAVDTAQPEAMEAALRLYAGRAMLNSINLSPNAERLFAAARMYGAAPVLMPLDGWSLPPTSSGRMAVIDALLERARPFGFDRSNVLIDCGTPCATMCRGTAQEAVEFVREMRGKGYRTIAGVSNVSYGLPRRESLNTAFLAELMSAGLSAAILNPTRRMMDTAAACGVLRGDDEYCAGYLARMRRG